MFAVDYCESVVFFGKSQLQQTCTINVHYINGDRDHSPLPKNSMDVVINAWAELNPEEARRTLKPNGYLIQLGAIPNALCGELTSQLVHDYPWLPKDCAPLEVFEPGYPDTCFTADSSIGNGIPILDSIYIHQFTYVADYKDFSEAASISRRVYGPKAKHYFMTRR